MAVFFFGVQQGWAGTAATVTTLAVSSSGSAVKTVESGSVVTLTATVNSGTSAVTTGQVRFCDASASQCTDIHLLGVGQLTSTGTATLKFAPGIGTHGYKAIFAGTLTVEASSSASTTLTVTGAYPTTTAISQSGNAGNYSLTASVTGTGGLSTPSGTVSFVDTSNGNAVLGTGILGTSATSLNFLKPTIPAPGSNPISIVAGDFNKDGIPDLAIANSGSGTITVLLGKGDGTFTQAVKSPIAVGDTPWSLAVSDFNGDGNPDLAVANFGDNSVGILLGTGDGTFTALSPASVGNYPDFLAVSDFNGDGIPDLAVVNSGDKTVSILLGNGNGSFAQAVSSPIPLTYAYFITVGDFNGDGISDLAVVNGYGTVAVFVGKGDGTFTQVASPVFPGQTPSSIAVADFNGDGIPDLAVANYGDDTVTISIGNGDGTFTQARSSTITVGNGPMSIVVGDFNGDGIADLATVNCGSNTVTVVLGNGDGTFRQTANGTVTVGAGPVSLVAADLNRDGIFDLAVANLGDGTGTVLLSNLTQTAQATLDISAAGIGAHLVEATYPGDSNYGSSKSNSLAVRGQLVTPTVIVTPTSSSVTTAQGVSVTVTVNGDGSAPTPTGTVSLTSGNYSSAASTLSAGTVTINIMAGALALGADTLTANYTPDSSSSANYGSGIGSASVVVSPPAPITPTVTVTPSSSGITATQGLTVTVTVTGGSGNPIPSGLVTLTSSTPYSGSSPLIYDTFQYSNDTLIDGKVAQSGNSTWITGGGGIGEIEDTHLINSAPSGFLGVLYAELANTSTVGGTPTPVTTLGGTIRMCPSPSGTYDPGDTAVGLIAMRDGTFKNALEIGFGPASWWVIKSVNGVGTWVLTGTENLSVDCKTDYTVQMILNPSAGTFQVIPPNGVPSAVIADPDITAINALYGTWEPENNSPNKYRGLWGSVWMGGGYTSPAATLSAGTATIRIPAGSLAVGSDTLTASFTPDSFSSPIYTSSAGPAARVTVSKAKPAVTVTPSSSGITTTQPLTVTVAVNGGGSAPTPTGTVIITGGGYTSAASVLLAGTVTFTIPAGSLVSGTDTLTASYTPDPSSSPTYSGSTGVSAAVSVVKTTPTVTVTPSSLSISVTQALTVQVAVNGGSGAPSPSGTVSVTRGGYTSGTVALIAGSATINIPSGSLALGANALTASYSPASPSSAIFNGSTGVSASLAVAATRPTVTVTPSSSSITTTQALNVAIAVTGGTGNPLPTGTVTLTGGGYTSTATALSSGSASISIGAGSLAGGSDTLTASYTPDAASSLTYSEATAVSSSVSVAKVTPRVTVTPSSLSITTTQGLTVTVVVGSGSGTPIPTGSVTVTGGGYKSTAASLNAGSASISIPAEILSVGSNTLMATYTPDSAGSPVYNGSSGNSSAVIVAKVTPTVTVTPSPTTITAKQGMTVAVAVGAGNGTPAPAGTVTVTGEGYISAAAPLNAGLATISIPAGSLTVGMSALTATYSGDPTYNASAGSANVTVSQIAITLGDVSLVAPGTGVTATATILGDSAYSGTMRLDCALTASPNNAQSLPTCSLSPNSLAITPGQGGTTVVTVHTTTNTITASKQDLWPLGGGGVVLAGVLLFGISPRRRSWMSLLVLFSVLTVTGIMGCSGGGNASFAPTGASSPATTVGSYTFTVAGTDSVNPAITASTSFTITVQ